MYRIKKVLNHNAVIAVRSNDNCGYMILGKGIGFGKKVTEKIEARPGDTVYSLQKDTERGNASELAKTISPICLEIANEILNEAEKRFKEIDRSIFFPIADHIEFAVKRIKNGEQINNPLTEDIRVLFHAEYETARCIEPLLMEKLHIQIDEDEIGYIALHIHTAIDDVKVSQAMQTAQAVRKCISLVEKEIGQPIDIMSLSYNRLMNHVRYMVARTLKGEKLKVNMNDYMKIKFPQSYQIAESVCAQIEKSMNCRLEHVEIGYLAMHIERVASGELDSSETEG
ncbi:PRD domain-containing protein [Lachnospiraceae bacterium 62-35]